MWLSSSICDKVSYGLLCITCSLLFLCFFNTVVSYDYYRGNDFIRWVGLEAREIDSKNSDSVKEDSQDDGEEQPKKKKKKTTFREKTVSVNQLINRNYNCDTM